MILMQGHAMTLAFTVASQILHATRLNMTLAFTVATQILHATRLNMVIIPVK